jgi:dTDP-4-amino-4,6-dideoxygalactose transaminase
LPSNRYNAHHLFIIEVDNRKELYNYLRLNNIFSQIHYIPVHLLPYYKDIGYGEANLINSEKYYSKCISLPMYPTLKSKEQNFVIDKVLNFISND